MRQARMRPAPGRSSRWRYRPAWAKTRTVIGAANFEPLGRPLAPEQAPEDVAVAGDDLADDEREVDPEREPDDVEDDERRDRERAPHEREDRPAREHVEARGADVTVRRRGLRRRRARRLRRRSDLAGHRRGSLEPRHVVPRDARRSGERTRGERVEIRRPARGARAAAAATRRSARRRASSRSVSWKYTCTSSGRSRRPERAGEVPERVRRRNRAQARPGRQLDAGGRGERRPRAPVGEVRRTRRARRAVDVAELRAGLRDLVVRVPAAAAEERRREPELAQPRSLGTHALAGARRPSGAHGRAPSSACGGRAGRARRPRARARPRRSSSSPNAASAGRMSAAIAKAARTRSLQRREPRPDRVVERSLNVAGDDRVPFPDVAPIVLEAR